ncbi:hypothetical protein C7S10_14700 [Nocardioides currus]|uniref:Uncharacterized protein n=1 Tax=Nocardioides currus TaxID=2133958 RepID=A0A2R7YVL8_9ACTN|nr:hypothetical protein C7S10_14700 [Nocardioides currus]
MLAAGLLVAAPPTGEASGTDPTAGLPERLGTGVIVDLADGDRFKVVVSPDQRTVWGSRYDAATSAWGERSVVLRAKDLYCGNVDARAAGTAIAVIARCDRGGYADDQAPTHSQALYSPDGSTWQRATLPGEAYDEPGISPSGNAAIWPVHQGWVTWTNGRFTEVERSLPGQEYTITGMISDAGDVSVMYGEARDRGRDCVMTVLDVAATGAESRQELDVPNACADVWLANVDATTVFFGEREYPASAVTITRPDTASPWAVTGPAPDRAPGLVRHRGRGTATTLFTSSPGLPLLAVGSPDKRTFYAQSYDPVAHSWSAPTAIRTGPTACTWGDNFIQEPLGVFALRVRCGKAERVLVSVDGATWTDVSLAGRPLGVAPDHAEVSVSNARRTLVFSREEGVVRLPVGGDNRCDAVQPVSPDTAIRLTASTDRGWPSRLEVSTSSGWRRTDTTIPRSRVGDDTCRESDVALYERPTTYNFLGRRRVASLVVTPRGDGWVVRRGTY